MSFDPDEIDRYTRQITLPEVGPEGQRRLRESRVLVVGAGGLGSTAIAYLAAAGVGRLGIADGDDVERSNLGRQVVHGTDDIGRGKAESARDFVAGLNPDVSVETHGHVDDVTVADLVDGHDVVVDATDDHRTRCHLNAACKAADRPLVHGAAQAFEGRATTFRPDGPCYRCLTPGQVEADDCAATSVFGPVPGLVGCVQAAEALKLVVDTGEPLAGRLLVYDALGGVESIAYRARPDCPVCDAGADEAG